MLVTAAHLKALPSPASELERLFRDHSEQVFRTAYRITANVIDAEDVVQTIFLRLARRQRVVKLEPSPASYLHRAAINAALDLIRHRRRYETVSLTETAALTAHFNLNPESQHRNREIRAIIQRAIADLSEKTAEIFVLRYFEGYNNREIADLLGISQVLVGVLLHRARVKMKKQISRMLEGDHEKN